MSYLIDLTAAAAAERIRARDIDQAELFEAYRRRAAADAPWARTYSTKFCSQAGSEAAVPETLTARVMPGCALSWRMVSSRAKRSTRCTMPICSAAGTK